MESELNELFWSNSFYGGFSQPSHFPTQSSGLVPDVQYLTPPYQSHALQGKPAWQDNSLSKPVWSQTQPVQYLAPPVLMAPQRPTPPVMLPTAAPTLAEDEDIFSLLSNQRPKDLPLDLSFPTKQAPEDSSVDISIQPAKTETQRSLKKAFPRKRSPKNASKKIVEHVLCKEKDKEKDKEEEVAESEDDSDSDNHVKKKRRLEKNREAAQQFRQRQKTYIRDLEDTVNKLNTEKIQFQSKVDLLFTENRLIKEQLSYLKEFINHVISNDLNKCYDMT